MSIPLLKSLTDRELLDELGANKTLRARVRAKIVHTMTSIEQAQGQRAPVGTIEVRRRELQLAQEIVELVIKELA